MKRVIDTELRRLCGVSIGVVEEGHRYRSICGVSIGVGEEGHRYRLKKNLWCIYKGR